MTASTLFWGDALEATAQVDSAPWDCVYLDPPYGVGTFMTARCAPGEMRGRKIERSGPVAYDDRYNVDTLLDLLAPRLSAVRARMSPQGVLFLHLDHRSIHEVKVLCDEVFGRGAFLTEVIWTPGNGSKGKGPFAISHQTILCYAQSPKATGKVQFARDHELLRKPFAATSLAMHFKEKDASGRHFRERKVGGKVYRYYADEGRSIGSVWTDIPAMVANSPIQKEATGYPTQKPEKLLERILRSCTAPGSVVADLMCGSGTTLAVAHRLGLQFVGADLGEIAIQTASKRLAAQGARFTLMRSQVPDADLDMTAEPSGERLDIAIAG